VAWFDLFWFGQGLI